MENEKKEEKEKFKIVLVICVTVILTVSIVGFVLIVLVNKGISTIKISDYFFASSGEQQPPLTKTEQKTMDDKEFVQLAKDAEGFWPSFLIFCLLILKFFKESWHIIVIFIFVWKLIKSIPKEKLQDISFEIDLKICKIKFGFKTNEKEKKQEEKKVEILQPPFFK